MLTIPSIVINHVIEEIRVEYERMYGEWDTEYGSMLGWATRLALENIANSDMLYHNMDHTIMVTRAGQQILRGKHLSRGGVTPHEWMHFTIALLCHDVGYVHGICAGDADDAYVTGVDDHTEPYDRKGTNAALTPYHVDRSKRFIYERFADHDIIDAKTIAAYIEMTRFPVPKEADYQVTDGYPGLLRAADLIGQLGDPDYLRKLPALFYEFAETGINDREGYKNPGDLRQNYATFYWGMIYPYIVDGIRYLRVTQEGKQWIANFHSHVFMIEHADA